jgi:hypothetical protein
MFPLWDVLFRTAYRPAMDEFPATGLIPSVKPSLAGAFLWPLSIARGSRT